MASKIKISINRTQANSIKGLGLPLFFHALKTSDLFDIDYHDETCGERHRTLQTLFICNGRKIVLDTFESAYTTCSKEILEGNYDLILKLQQADMPVDDIVDFVVDVLKTYSVDEIRAFYNKVVPWTFFHSRMFERDWKNKVIYTPSPHTNIGFFCGRDWDKRKPHMDELRQSGIEVFCSNHGGVPDIKLQNQDFIKRMLSSRLGIVLEGIDSPVTNGKNRREMDYMMVRKPLLLDYKPFYYNPLIPGKHYVYWDKNIKELNAQYTNRELAEIEQNAYEWYNNNASRLGVAKSLRQILQEKCII